ncbi:MAG: energy transducer TonB [Candidatus Eremiobacteraeota bacterium]|nr:energy transducer TonB [Candidatus Eremiobacteraeota bacterium]MBV8669161.1 energy transducer TonB [Candidatus Eremiobacteraeota bacterium]
MHRNAINHTWIAAVAALVAVIGTVSSALAYETGYGPVQLINATQIDDPPGACTSADKPAGISRAWAPQYPEIALQMNQEGFSTVTFSLALDGSVSNVKLAGTSGNRLLDQAAVDAVKSSRFTPATQKCNTIAGTYGVPVVFSLRNANDWPNMVIGSGGGTAAARQVVK